MNKRGNESGQVSREEFEALDDTEESDVQGIFARASTEELAARKIIRVKKRGGEGIRDDSINTNSLKPIPVPEKSLNPFASFGNALTQPALTAPTNPFGGFSGLVIPPVKPTTNGFTNQFNIQPAQLDLRPTTNGFTNQFNIQPAQQDLKQNSSSFSFENNKPPQAFTVAGLKASSNSAPVQNDAISVNGGNLMSTESNYKKKMTKLNGSILSWMDRQIVEHPISIWKDGLKDYVRYATEISEKYGDEKISDQSSHANDLKSTHGLESAPPPQAAPLLAPAKAPSAFSGFTLPNSTSTFTGFSLPSTGATVLPTHNGDTGFNLGKSSFSTAPVPTPAPISFGMPSTSSSSFGAPPLSFGGGVGGIPAVTGGFTGFGGVGASSGFPPAATGSNGNNDSSKAEGDEEEGEPIMEAEKIMRNENDKDKIMYEGNSKLYRFDSEKNEWADLGKNNFLMTKCTETGKERMLVRNSVGKILFNAGYYKGMKVDKNSKGMLSFGVVTDATGKLRNFMLKVKDPDVVLDLMNKAIANM
jgi:hypothetical protein